MNRYHGIKTEDPAILILDTIIRFPDEMEGVMTKEAKAIRDKLPALLKIARVHPTQAEVLSIAKGRGWQPWPEDAGTMNRYSYQRSYTAAITKIGKYLEQTGELTERLVVA